MSKDSVEFVAVNYFGSSALRPFLDSLIAQDSDSWRLDLLDNSNDSAEFHRLEERTRGSARIQVHRTPGNLGYFGAVRWWLEHRSGPPAKWTVVSNVDV